MKTCFSHLYFFYVIQVVNINTWWGRCRCRWAFSGACRRWTRRGAECRPRGSRASPRSRRSRRPRAPPPARRSRPRRRPPPRARAPDSRGPTPPRGPSAARPRDRAPAAASPPARSSTSGRVSRPPGRRFILIRHIRCHLILTWWPPYRHLWTGQFTSRYHNDNNNNINFNYYDLWPRIFVLLVIEFNKKIYNYDILYEGLDVWPALGVHLSMFFTFYLII